MVNYEKYNSPEQEEQNSVVFDRLMKGMTANEKKAEKDGVEKIQKIPLANLVTFKDHPFQVRRSDNDKDFEELKNSIAENGVKTPIIVRPKGKTHYEIISGHRRTEACKELKIARIPALIKKLTDDEATTLMVELNYQRPDWLPSEKAFAYKMRLEAIKHQGTSSQIGTKSRSDEALAQSTGESRNQIQRYIRLTNLIKDLLKKVDEGDISVNSGYEFSFLNKDEQQTLLKFICDFLKKDIDKDDTEEKKTAFLISISQAKEIRALSAKENNEKSRISTDSLENIFGTLSTRYLTRLVDGLLKKVNNGEIPVDFAYQISFLNKNEQQTLLDFLTKSGVKKLSLNHAKQINALSAKENNEESKISTEALEFIFNKRTKDEKTNNADKKHSVQLSLFIPSKTLEMASKDNDLVKEIEELIRNWAEKKGLDVGDS